MGEYLEPFEQTEIISEEHGLPENISITDDGTIDSSIIEKKMKDVLKKTSDKGYNKLKFLINREITKIEVYDTGSNTGSMIRLATSGVRMAKHYVGSKNEDLYFKVIYTGLRHKTSKMGNEALFLYYESPEQWERHFKTTCPADVKAKWNQKYHTTLRRQFSNK